jgi:hypothetical protein
MRTRMPKVRLEACDQAGLDNLKGLAERPSVEDQSRECRLSAGLEIGTEGWVDVESIGDQTYVAS